MDFINTWAQSIIVAVIIATIIEILLPNGSNSKYIKVVIGIFVLFTIVSPIINKFSSNNSNINTNFDKYVQTTTNETVAASMNINNEDSIRKMYEENLKIDIKTKVTQKGYIVGNINLEISNDTNYTLNKIDIKITAKTQIDNSNERTSDRVTTIIENIENIKISIGSSRNDNEEKEEPSVISESEKRELKKYLSSVYEVHENNILVN